MSGSDHRTQDLRRRRTERRRRQVQRRRATALGLGLVLVATVAVAATRGGGGTTLPQAAGGAPVTTTGGTTTAAPPASAGPVSVAATGDIVMGSLPYGLPPDGGASFFRPVDSLITGDVVIGNLEGTLATGGVSKCGEGGSPNCFAFRTPPSYARWLRQAGFTVMSLANNHAMDFGAQGQRETVTALDRNRIRHTGRPGEIATQDVRGVKVAVVAFAPYEWASSLTDLAAARRLVQKADRDADVVVVSMHAGAEGSDQQHVRPGTETFLGENRGDTMAFSRAVIDAGADLVVGHGPHVLRGMQFYKGRLIAYSLGNFAGYKVFSLGGPLSTSGVLQVRLATDGRYVSGRLRPTELVGAGTPAPGGDAASVVAELSREDFGSTAARVSADGTIRPPARS